MVFMLAIGAGASVPVGRADTTHDQLDVVDWDGGGDDSWVGAVDGNPQATVATVKVGLLASARGLQHDLDDLTRRANTASARGLAEVASEVAVALGRHPDYWTHAAVEAVEQPLSTAEGVYGARSVAERVKLEAETLSNVGGRGVHTVDRRRRPEEEARRAVTPPPAAYIVVTMVVAATGGLRAALPRRISSVSHVWRALDALAAVSTEDMHALEVLWAPQEEGDTLSEEEMLADHPELMRVG
eukprot:contig_16205_g3913